MRINYNIRRLYNYVKTVSPDQLKCISQFKNKGSILIGQFDPFASKEVLNKFIKKKINIFYLNLLPRITRAQ